MKKKPGIALIIAEKIKNKGKDKPEQSHEGEDYDEGLMFIEAFDKAKSPEEKLQAFKDLVEYCKYQEAPVEGE